MCPGCGIVYCIQTLSAQMVSQNNTLLESCATFFIRLTTLNNCNIDKDLLLNLNLYPLTAQLILLLL